MSKRERCQPDDHVTCMPKAPSKVLPPKSHQRASPHCFGTPPACTSAPSHARTHARTCTRTHRTHAHAPTQPPTHKFTLARTCTRTHSRTRTHQPTSAHAHTLTHPRTHPHTHTCSTAGSPKQHSWSACPPACARKRGAGTQGNQFIGSCNDSMTDRVLPAQATCPGGQTDSAWSSVKHPACKRDSALTTTRPADSGSRCKTCLKTLGWSCRPQRAKPRTQDHSRSSGMQACLPGGCPDCTKMRHHGTQ